jgi:hypothetical protein
MNFFCVYASSRKKLDKMIKNNHIENKYILDIKKLIEKEEIDIKIERTYLKVLIYKKIKQAVEKNKDIYYIPYFDNDFSIEKLINIKKILSANNTFNIIIFYNDFLENENLINIAFNNLSKFDNSQVIRDY